MTTPTTTFPKAVLYTFQGMSFIFYDRKALPKRRVSLLTMLLINPPFAHPFSGSLWGSVPSLCMIEKGYSASDYEVRQVNLLQGENFAPTYLRVNSKGTVPTLVVPLADTTGQEVDTKFRAINDSIEIVQFLGEAGLVLEEK